MKIASGFTRWTRSERRLSRLIFCLFDVTRTTLWKIEADGGRLGPQLDAVGLACNPLLGSLWVLYADRSLSYFSEPLASRDACWTLPGAISDLRSAQGLPGHVLTKATQTWH